MSTEAKVELLTAEVRTLMVGNRQVTLSVAKQLDWIKLENLEPFGRVRINNDDDLAIGRDRRSGALAIAKYQRHFGDFWVDASDLGGCRIKVCKGLVAAYRDGVRLNYKGQKFMVDLDSCTRCDVAEHRYGAKSQCEHWEMVGDDPNLGYDHILLQLTVAQERRELNKATADLPLIVLAGLR